MHIAIVGRQPYLGIAELERIYGATTVSPIIESDAVLIDSDCSADDLKHLGGSIKLATVLTTVDTTKWHDIEKHLSKAISEHLRTLPPEGKFRFGISIYGLDMRVDAINASTLRLKKIAKAAGRSSRVVPNKALALNSAQVIHNQLTSPIGAEFIVVRYGRKTIIARTIAEQDIDAYAARDQARPARDAFVGMLPPKLAQVMINLAYPSVSLDSSAVILDPFCGTGVILQEAALMGYDVYGTDYSEKMIRYSNKNLEWLKDTFQIQFDYKLEVADATNAKWDPFTAVACETYLGQPFSAPPSPSKLEEVMQNCDHIISEFLQNIGSQMSSGTPLCLGVPAWRSDNGWVTHLPLIKKLNQLGYKQIEFKHVVAKNLLYYRPDQVVARELLVLEKS